MGEAVTEEVTSAPGGRWRRPVRYAVGVSVIALLLYQLDWSHVRQSLAHVSLWLIAAAFATMAFSLVVSAWKWGCSLRLHGMHHPFGFLATRLCIGFFFNSFLPTAVGGDAYRIVSTLPQDGHRSRAVSAVIIERGMGFLALIVLGAVGALRLASEHQFAYQYWSILLSLAALGIVGFVALENGWLHRFANRWRQRSAVSAVLHNLELLRHRRSDWLELIIGSLGFQLVSIAALAILFYAVSGEMTLAKCALIAAAVGVAAALPISINGLGVMEGALVAAAVALRLDYDQAVIVAFMRRALSIALAVVCGGLWLMQKRRAGAGVRNVGFLALLTILQRDGPRALIDALRPPTSPPESDVPPAAKRHLADLRSATADPP